MGCLVACLAELYEHNATLTTGIYSLYLCTYYITHIHILVRTFYM
jgi:hypothetical protein